MKYILSGLFVCVLSTICFSQQDSITTKDLAEMEESSRKWLENLYTASVQKKGDSIKFNDEARLILKDTNYAKIIYPKIYTWDVTQVLLQKSAIKQALWYMINLYYADKNNKELVINMVVPLDQVLQMDKILISTYYSYIAFDPQVTTILNGKTSEILRPDIAEHKLIAVKEIVDYIMYYRAQKKGE